MPSVLIGGVPVEFPFEPYPQQKDYMQVLLAAIQSHQNALLESPTGTGKTLAVLCSVLAFQKRYHDALRYVQDLSANLSTQARPQRVASLEHFILSVPELFSQFFYRVHLPLSRGSRVVPQRGADDALAEVRAKVRAMPVPQPTVETPRWPTLVYTSRTHSQISQVMKALKAMKPALPSFAVVLGSRRHCCLSPDARRLEATIGIDAACRQLVRAGACIFKDRASQEATVESIMAASFAFPDIEEFKGICKKRTACPYIAARQLLSRRPSVVVAPYNYVVGSTAAAARGGVREATKDSVLVFDEGHNLPDNAKSGFNRSVLVGDAAACVLSLQHITNHMLHHDSHAAGAAQPDRVRALTSVVLVLEERLKSVCGAPLKLLDPKDVFKPLFEKVDFLRECEQLFEDVMGYNAEHSVTAVDSLATCAQFVSGLVQAHDSSLLDAFGVCALEPQAGAAQRKDTWGSILAHGDGAGKLARTTVGFWCFSAAPMMRALRNEQHVRSVVVTSGTLSPLGATASEFGIPFPLTLQNTHVIDPRQLAAGVVQTFAGVRLNSAHRNRENAAYQDALGKLVTSVARATPGGVLVFFASSRHLKTVKERWELTGALGALQKARRVIVGLGDGQEFQKQLSEFTEFSRGSSKDPLLLAVCRGRFSEGVDFSDRLSRSVVMCGVPYPPFKDPQIVLQREYMDRQRGADPQALSGSEWYNLQSARAVNQAIGRTIRHRKDYGAIILADERFAQRRQIDNLPGWIRKSLTVFPTRSDAWVTALVAFFQKVSEIIPATPTSEPAAAAAAAAAATVARARALAAAPAATPHVYKPRAREPPSLMSPRPAVRKSSADVLQAAKHMLSAREFAEIKRITRSCMLAGPKLAPSHIRRVSDKLFAAVVPPASRYNQQRRALLRELGGFFPAPVERLLQSMLGAAGDV